MENTKENSSKYKGNWTIFYFLNLRHQNELLTTFWSWGRHCRGTNGNLNNHLHILYVCHMSFIICYIWHKCQICHIWRWHMTYMSKYYKYMGVKSFVKTSTIQPAAPKLFKVHFDILNLKNKKWSNFLCIFWNFRCFFHVLFHHQIKKNFRKLLFIYMIMTSTQIIFAFQAFLTNTTSGGMSQDMCSQ
jgi:hypothetical protein